MTKTARGVALTVLIAATAFTSCATDDRLSEPAAPAEVAAATTATTTTSPAEPTTPSAPTEPEPEPGIDTTTMLEGAGWWDYASGIVGVAFADPASRAMVAADVDSACRFLATDATAPDDFAEYVAGLDRIATNRGDVAGRPLETRSYAIALDAAIDLVCPGAVAALASLSPAPPGIAVDDNIRGSTVVVPDPAPGDLRVDPDADVLPADYRHPDPPRVMLDLAYHDDPAQKLDLFLPAVGGAPLVAYLHSGGWVGGDKQFVPEMVMRLVEEGYAVASIGYRLAPTHPFPAPVQDVKHAIRFLKAHAIREGSFDPDRIVLAGASAGGHLAAFAAATPGQYEPTDLSDEEAAVDSGVVGVVSMVGPTDLVGLYTTDHPWAAALTGAFMGCVDCTDEQLWEGSPIAHLQGGGLPPAYWAYGEDDTLVRADSQGLAIATAWGDASGRYGSWLDLVEGRGHNMDHTTINQRWLESFIAFVTTPGPFPIG